MANAFIEKLAELVWSIYPEAPAVFSAMMWKDAKASPDPRVARHVQATYEVARLVLLAAREPSEAMVEAMVANETNVRDQWQAAIDRALKE